MSLIRAASVVGAVSLVGVLSLVSSAFASTPVAPSVLLQKLSLKLRASVPTAAETAAFEAKLQAAPDRFAAIYAEEIAAYLRSEPFLGVVEMLHTIWWRVPMAESSKLAARIVFDDRPYGELFDRQYVYLDGLKAGPYRRAGIRTEEPLPTVAGDWRAVRLADDETRFRSVLSNLDLLNQFPDTPTNRNRARANHMFRTFLCESLTPTEPVPEFVAEAQALGGSTEDDHGTDPDCIGCHWRLDPMARFFDGWRPPFPDSVGTWFDSSQAAAGKAIVRVEDGSYRVHEGASETELARLLFADPRLRSCVAKRAWEFVFGTGVKLPEDVQASLVATFNRRQSYKELLSAVLNHPYFWSTDEAPALRFADVKVHFSGCGGSCHSTNGRVEPKFDPGAYPFATDSAANARVMTRIWGAINHAVGFVAMPRAPRPKLANEALSALRDWIVAGAHDDTGRPTLNDDQIRGVLDE